MIGGRTAAMIACLGCVIASGPACADVELADLATIVVRHQITHPHAEDIPVDSPAAFAAYLSRIDRYATRLSKDEYQALLLAGLPKAQGLGGSVFPHGDKVRWIAFRNGPAAAASVPAEGMLLEINRQPVTSADLSATVKAIIDDGKPTVQLRFSEPERDYEVRRERTGTPVLDSWQLEGRAFVRVFSFVEGRTASAIRSAIGEAPEVILDMRFCDGGSVFEAFDATGIFLDPGLPVGGIMSADNNRTDFTAPGRGNTYRGKLTILTSLLTASAAELFIAALQFHHRAGIAGTPTYGKCEAQRTFPLSDGGALRISVERIIRPSGNLCDTEPVVPTQPIANDQIFDTPSLLGTIGVPMFDEHEPLVCDVERFKTGHDAHQRDLEIREVYSLDDLPTMTEPGYPLSLPNMIGHQLCYGPMKDRTAADTLAKQLSGSLQQPFRRSGEK